MVKKQNIPTETIKRMIAYLRYLERVKDKGVKIISSRDITLLLNIPPAQFRKDLSFFGEFGKRGVGYNVENLIDTIKKLLGLNKKIKVIVVGAGRLGTALIQYPGFSEINIEIIGAFDINPQKVGQSIKGINIYNIKDIKKFITKNNIKIAILCVPADAAQSVADLLIEAKIKSILNFAPVVLILPEGINIANVDMAGEIGSIIYRMKEQA
ncbi:MAG: redox-sensing transcriptional repressor Rex [Candidatus Ratteibacteria bacterium]|nr:redox-sensing transcriptional repressor Rex [Candidatus Ratteibacteria bacterium]